MTRTIAQRALRNQSAAIMDAVADGQSFIVTRRGVPIAELRPISEPRKQAVSRGELAAAFANAAHLDARQLREDLDRFIEPGLSR